MLYLDEGSYTISDDVWDNAKRKLRDKFKNNLNFEIVANIIKDFEATNLRIKYKSDLEIFIRESKLEDFAGENIETIFVSTIHKAKGREFDNVFLVLDKFNLGTDEAKRQLYVAMTRAKRNLNIHYNGNYLDYIKTEGLMVYSNSNIFPPPAHLAMQLTYRDVWLDFFISRQKSISQFTSGEILAFDGDCCRNSKGELVLKFSKQLIKQIEALKQKKYLPKIAKIRFIVFWQKENSEQEIRIILPELEFEKAEDFRNSEYIESLFRA
jgi:ATP-dependent DNA helicase RecQ